MNKMVQNTVFVIGSSLVFAYGPYSTILSPEHRETLNRFLNDEEAFLELIVKSASFVCLDDTTIVGMAFLIPSGNRLIFTRRIGVT